MYVLAAWTGFRKGEIGSLWLKSLRLDEDPPTATVEACFSERKRQDTQVLHPELAGLLSEWRVRPASICIGRKKKYPRQGSNL